MLAMRDNEAINSGSEGRGQHIFGLEWNGRARGEHRDMNNKLRELLRIEGRKARILKGGRVGMLRHVYYQWSNCLKAANTPPQTLRDG